MEMDSSSRRHRLGQETGGRTGLDSQPAKATEERCSKVEYFNILLSEMMIYFDGHRDGC